MKNLYRVFWLFLLTFLAVFNLKVRAQNLVYNGGFEEFKKPCPSFGELEAAKGWFQVTGSSDYFNPACTLETELSTPKNIHGYQIPQSGKCYAGFAILTAPTKKDGFYHREYLHTKLLSKLVAGKSYKVAFYLSLAESSGFYADHVSVSFTQSNRAYIVNPKYNLLKGPHNLTVKLGQAAKDTANWFRVELQFTATGGEQYLVIGSFEDDITKSALKKLVLENAVKANEKYAYYFVDDVSVILME